MKLSILSLGAALAALSLPAFAQEEAHLMRFPHVRGDQLVFCKGGDVWAASVTDGKARRLTSWDEGYEVFPRISPDGKHVAFSGEYGGTRQVFVVPFEGGTPKQLTFYPDVGNMPPRGGYDNIIMDWTPDGRHILIRSNRTPYGQRVGRYFLVPADGKGMPKALQVPEGGPASLSPDGSKLTYNIISREWRTWKRYTAGRAQDVWIYDLLGNKIEQVTDFSGTDNWPMWVGDRIYYTSDRTGTLNIWCYETSSKVTRQVTKFDDFDVLFPSRGGDQIVFECGGSIHLLDTKRDETRKLTITLADDKPWTRPHMHNGASAFGSFTPSPNAKRAVVEFRGDLFSVPRKNGEVRNITNTPSRRESNPDWSPSGTHVAFLAETGLDQELFVRGMALGEETQLTAGTDAWILGYSWSHDSSTIAATDTRGRLWTVDARTRERKVLDESVHGWIFGFDWSSDGKWLCYQKPGANGNQTVWVVHTEDGNPRQVTNADWNCGSPSWDPKGRWLYYTSNRDWNYGDRSFEQRVYALILQADGESPVVPLEDEEDAGSHHKPEGHDEMTIDFDGLMAREVVLPLPTGSYGGLIGTDDGLMFMGRGQARRYSHKSRKAATVLSSGFGFALTPDRSQVLYRHGGNLCVAGTTPGQSPGSNPLPTDRIDLRIHPTVEWKQMYTEAWRIMRDWFYDPNMHGVDWEAMREKYLPLVDHVSHRADLDFLLGELIGELNCGHTYVQSGETPRADRTAVGVLGCEFEVVEGRHRITKIFDSANWDESTRNPLTAPGVDVEVGDYLIAIDGHEITGDDNPYRHLVGKVGRRVKISVNDSPRAYGAEHFEVRPARSELGMRYLTWVNNNRRIVSELSGGRIGYFHVPNTASDGHKAVWHGWSQSQVSDAMIVDDRYNGGGHIPSDMAYRIGQPPLNWWSRRHRDLYSTPGTAFDGPRVMLINGYSSSGGDAFPYYFRQLKIGKLMGATTWGGLVGYSGSPTLVDGGGLAVPAFSFVNNDGEWDVEAFGVEPDLPVFDDPTQIQAGREPMLEAAVRHLLEELEKNPGKGQPDVPKGPDRSGLVDPDSAPFRKRR